MKSKIIYIEDDTKDLKKYKRVLETEMLDGDGFRVIEVAAQELEISTGFSNLEQEEPDLILVDLNLSRPKNNKIYNLSGAATSTAFREKFQGIPIVLFTRRDIIKGKFPAINQMISGIDDIIFKDDIRTDSEKINNTLLELIEGYKTIREIEPRSMQDLLNLLVAPEKSYDSIKLADPPLFGNSRIPDYLIAHWIRKNILYYPGILYDSIHSATSLGISKEAFLTEEIQSIFKESQYSGVFKPIEGRWWKSRLHFSARNIMNSDEKDLPLREGFPSSLDRKNNSRKIERSKCTFSNESPAEWVCCILKEPMMVKYSLSYKADFRPKVMDEARVSFKAIRRSNEFKEELLSDPSASNMQDIKKMRIRRG